MLVRGPIQGFPTARLSPQTEQNKSSSNINYKMNDYDNISSSTGNNSKNNTDSNSNHSSNTDNRLHDVGA